MKAWKIPSGRNWISQFGQSNGSHWKPDCGGRSRSRGVWTASLLCLFSRFCATDSVQLKTEVLLQHRMKSWQMTAQGWNLDGTKIKLTKLRMEKTKKWTFRYFLMCTIPEPVSCCGLGVPKTAHFDQNESVLNRLANRQLWIGGPKNGYILEIRTSCVNLTWSSQTIRAPALQSVI